METSRKQETGLKEEQKWERIALGVWKVRFGTPSAYTPTAHRSNEIKTEALSVLSAEQGAEPQLPFGTDDVNIKQTTRGNGMFIVQTKCQASYRGGNHDG